ncbi:hypothetical protein CDV31_014344 [Fusarium ambrosium]|uniref:aldehyde dehydrogenase (NAD(+)) n=1 Tax=Fusarium ambrosium TaxID=131363 RepID=A0A428SXC8_9HYPO|nr:hypothetical protein CDV31_014344 [Fusarium ambrosium]
MYGQRLAELVMEAAFPPGVINILCGIGSVAGQALADHREVRKISFTGITVVGRQLLATSSKTNLKKGRGEKAKLLHGGDDSGLPSNGHFVPNTAFSDVDPTASIIQEEIFGPVACIAHFRTEEEAIELANGTSYGLASAVFTENVNRAIRVGESLESGQVTANMWGTVNVNTPFGGVKETGFGRNLGRDALDEWTHVKCIKFQVSNL